MNTKWLGMALMAGWFFGFQTPEGDLPGVFIYMAVGPFQTKLECDQYRQGTIESMQMVLGKTIDAAPCKELTSV